MKSKSLGVLVLWLAAMRLPVSAEEAPFVFFRAGFDGTTAAVSQGGRVAAKREAQAAYVKGAQAQALHGAAGCLIEHDLGDGFPARAGALEVWFKPGFPQKPDQAERTVFTLRGADDAQLSFGFVPQGTRWQFGIDLPGWRRPVAASNFEQQQPDQWHQLVLVWDAAAKPAPVVRFYRDGVWDRNRTEAFRKTFEGLRRLVIGGAGELATSVDEIVIYNRALTEADVAFLHRSIHLPDRFAALQKQIAADAELVIREKEERQALLAKLHGRVAQLINPRGGKQRDFKLPGGIVATGLRVEDVGRTDLSGFAVIYGPPGAGYQLTAAQNEVIRDYVRKGGGYVGVCAGANYAGKARLLNMTTHSLKNQGLVSVGVAPHAITRGFSGEVVIHHGNGPIMVPGEGCQVVGTFQVGQDFPIVTAAIVAGENGKGRVAAFGPHPTGGGVEYESKGAKFSGAELGTDTLLVNALLWAGRIGE